MDDDPVVSSRPTCIGGVWGTTYRTRKGWEHWVPDGTGNHRRADENRREIERDREFAGEQAVAAYNAQGNP